MSTANTRTITTNFGTDRTFDLLNPVDMIRYVARVQFAWPGGYELGIICKDGTVVCQKCIREDYREYLAGAISGGFSDDPVGIIIGCELDPELYFCENCNKDMSSYAETELLGGY